MKGFTTKVLHTKYSKKDAHGSLKMPVYDSVAFEAESAEEIALAFQGKKSAHIYSRITNPTIEYFEQQIKFLTDSSFVLALSSGMAAISNLVLTIARSGNNIITSKNLFGNTYSLFESTLKDWGLDIKYADLNNIQEVKSLVDDSTVAIFTETISNPQLALVDFKALSGITKDKKILLIADTTPTPPYLFDAKSFGIDIEVMSSTKYISGGATSVGGLIIDYGTFDWKNNAKLAHMAEKLGASTLITKLKREVYRNLGACLSPHNAYLQSLGLETLAMRTERSCNNTLLLAEFLSKDPRVVSVNYPGLDGSAFKKLADEQFPKGAGGLLTFDLRSEKECFNLINRLQIVRRSTNLNANQTLIIHPSSTIYSEYNKQKQLELGVRDTMIRLAVGIEDMEDLKEDLLKGLDRIG